MLSDRENILQRIEPELSKPVEIPYPEIEGDQMVFNRDSKDLVSEFTKEFVGLDGKLSARENILKNIELALSKPVEIPYPEIEGDQTVFNRGSKDLVSEFTKEFVGLEGKLILCPEKKELINQLQKLAEQKKWTQIHCQTPSLLKDLESLPFINKGTSAEAEVGITDCEYLVARTGTIVLSAAQSSGRILPVYVPVHLIIASIDNLIYDIGDAIDRIKEKYKKGLPSAIFFASGPSRTADIEKKLVLGVHGPKEVYLFLLTEKLNSQ